MIRATLFILAASAAAFAQTPVHKHYEESKEAETPAPTGQLAPRLQNLGLHTFPVTTKSKQAQLFVNQGVNLAYGFNHAEAGRAFREAARLDPTCAMAYWGQAAGARSEHQRPHGARRRAQGPTSWRRRRSPLKTRVSPRERAYIDALAKRYTGKARTGRPRPGLRGRHAGAWRGGTPKTSTPRPSTSSRSWTCAPGPTGCSTARPYEGTAEIVALAESVLERKPDHPGALHLYIHLMESTHPEKAEAAADRLLP